MRIRAARRTAPSGRSQCDGVRIERADGENAHRQSERNHPMREHGSHWQQSALRRLALLSAPMRIVFRNPDSFHETDLRPGIHNQRIRRQWLGDHLLPMGQQRPVHAEGVGFNDFGEHGCAGRNGRFRRVRGQSAGQSDAESAALRGRQQRVFPSRVRCDHSRKHMACRQHIVSSRDGLGNDIGHRRGKKAAVLATAVRR